MAQKVAIKDLSISEAYGIMGRTESFWKAFLRKEVCFSIKKKKLLKKAKQNLDIFRHLFPILLKLQLT